MRKTYFYLIASNYFAVKDCRERTDTLTSTLMKQILSQSKPALILTTETGKQKFIHSNCGCSRAPYSKVLLYSN